LPYEANSLSELTLRQQREVPARLDQLNPLVPAELARAVAMALAIDQESRPADALVLAEALRAGAHGIEPVDSSAPTAHLGTAAVTRVLPEVGRQAATAATRIEPAPPPRAVARRAVPARVASTPAPRRAPAVAADRAAAPAARRSGGFGRAMRRLFAVAALAIVLAAAVIVAVVIATGTSSNVTQLQRTLGNDAQSAITTVRDFINKHTR
jgi:serine/threonine-protein kinase